MPLVRMKTSLATMRHSFDEGAEVQASAEEAQSWLAADIAELVVEDRVLTPERGMRSEVRRGPGRPRKHPR